MLLFNSWWAYKGLPYKQLGYISERISTFVSTNTISLSTGVRQLQKCLPSMSIRQRKKGEENQERRGNGGRDIAWHDFKSSFERNQI